MSSLTFAEKQLEGSTEENTEGLGYNSQNIAQRVQDPEFNPHCYRKEKKVRKEGKKEGNNEQIKLGWDNVTFLLDWISFCSPDPFWHSQYSQAGLSLQGAIGVRYQAQL